MKLVGLEHVNTEVGGHSVDACLPQETGGVGRQPLLIISQYAKHIKYWLKPCQSIM